MVNSNIPLKIPWFVILCLEIIKQFRKIYSKSVILHGPGSGVYIWWRPLSNTPCWMEHRESENVTLIVFCYQLTFANPSFVVKFWPTTDTIQPIKFIQIYRMPKSLENS